MIRMDAGCLYSYRHRHPNRDLMLRQSRRRRGILYNHRQSTTYFDSLRPLPTLMFPEFNHRHRRAPIVNNYQNAEYLSPRHTNQTRSTRKEQTRLLLQR